MFREGQYLEVIKASDNCLATAIVTVKERTVEIEKKKISTNKWLTLEDWSELYGIIKKAILRNIEAGRGVDDNDDKKEKKKSLERRKSTRRLDIIYNFEAGDESSLPTIKVRVCRAKKRLKTESKTLNKQNNDGKNSLTNNDSPEMQVKRLMEGTDASNPDEEYVPPELSIKTKLDDNLNYIPSRKSLLKRMSKTKILNINNEYTPETSTEIKSPLSDCTTYIPNSISALKKKKRTHDIYEPPGLPTDLSDEYVPTSKSSSIKIDEYEPDFGTTEVDPSISYIPSSKKIINSDENQEYVPLRKKIRKEHEQKKLVTKKKCLSNVKREI